MIRTPSHRELAKKGWSEKEIQKTVGILQRAREKKTFTLKFLEGLLLYVTLTVFVIGNFIMSVVLVPFLILMKGIWLYLTVMLFAFTFGILFTITINYIEKLTPKKHIVVGLFIPAIALINIYIIVYFANKLEILLQLPVIPHSPVLIGIAYVFAFIIPYLTQHISHILRA